MSEFKKIPIILDGDPGHDDAIAWVLARASRKLEILAVTSCCGNQTIEKTTYNALRVCTLIGLHAPVGKGCPHPLLNDVMNAPSVHGESGLDGPALPEPAFEPSAFSAPELMAKVLRESPEPVTIVATGPQTNVAALLLAHPELKSKIARISLMGGGIATGNWTPAAEFNILVDPEAAKIVFTSGVPITMAGLDVTEKALILPEDFERVRALCNPVSDIVAQWLEFFYKFHRSIGYAGAPMHDPCAVMALIHPEIFTIRPMYVQIETAGEYCRGTTVGDLLGFSGHAPNADVLMGVDRDRFADLLVEAIKFYGRDMTNKQIPVWIDCDTGTDDSVAIMLAHALPELSVIGLSAVAGNSPLYNTFPNTRRVVHLLGADYPVYPGAERPLMREPHVAGKFHGENGLGDVELPLPDTAPESTFAWDALYATAKRMPGELRLVATGPLTNVAIALTKYPELKQLLHSIALMGGAAVGGNVTPAAEFNIYDDPDAAQIVFKSGVPLVMCGLDVTMQAELRPADWDEMAAYGNRCGKLVRELFACAWSAVQTVGLTGVAQHDSCPIMYLAHPELFEGQMAGVFVETQAEITLGKTVTDLQSDKKFGKKNALVLLKLDREAFMQILKDCIRTLP